MILLIFVWSLARPALPLDGPANRWMSWSVVAIFNPESSTQDRAVSCLFRGDSAVSREPKGCERDQMRLESGPNKHLTLVELDACFPPQQRNSKHRRFLY